MRGFEPKSFIRTWGVTLLLFLPGISAAQPSPASPPDLVQRIEAAEQTWLEATIDEPLLVSLGAFPDLSSAGVELTPVLRDRLILLNRKVFSNRQWRRHWVEQGRKAAEVESLWGELARTAPAEAEREMAIIKQTAARDWAALADAKVSNQDAYLVSIETERDVVEERLEGTLGSRARLDEEMKRAPFIIDPTPFEERAMRITELRFRQDFQRKRRAAAVLELKLLKRQTESSVALQHPLKRDVELANEEHRIAKVQLVNASARWTPQWVSIADAAGAKVKKMQEELDLNQQRQRSVGFEVSLAESQIVYRDRKHSEIEQERHEAEAFSSWLRTALATARQQIPRVLGLLFVIFLGTRLARWLVGLAARTLTKVVEDDDPDRVSPAERRAATISSVFKGGAVIVIYGVGVLLACDVVGINTGPILGSVAILGLAISFGAQNLVRDLVNGFFILVENQYGVGDWVKIGNYEGDVEQINVRSTQLRSVTGVLQIIPNGTITAVENMTRDWACFRCHVRVSYGSDIDLVERICNEVGAAMYANPELREKLLEAPTFVGVTALDDSAVVVRSSAKTQAGAQWSLEREMNRRLKKAFEEAGLEIPFPQQVVRHRREPSRGKPPS